MSDNGSNEVDWAAIIDLFASEYGWTIEYIGSLNLGQVIMLRDKIKARYDRQNGAVSEDGNSAPNGEETISDSDFVHKLGGKKHIREDGTTEIVL